MHLDNMKENKYVLMNINMKMNYVYFENVSEASI